MMHVKNLKDNIDLFKALSSEVRLDILNLLLVNNQLNMNDLSEKLKLTNGALTMHIKKLESCGLITTTNITGKHGLQKICTLHENKIIIDLANELPNNSYDIDLPLGHYSSYEIAPTCGIATKEKLIGEVDNPNYFASPERINADILWFTKGYIEYRLPNYTKPNEIITEIQLSLEISSEAPGTCDEWPSDILFSLNNIPLGSWTSPGDFGDSKGLFTPTWWPSSWNQYGLLKLITINSYGTFIDGVKLSDITLEDLNLDYRSDILFRLDVLESDEHIGGISLFGKSFGNYNQGIHFRILYNNKKNA